MEILTRGGPDMTVAFCTTLLRTTGVERLITPRKIADILDIVGISHEILGSIQKAFFSFSCDLPLSSKCGFQEQHHVVYPYLTPYFI